MSPAPISSGSGTADDPWLLKTPPLGADSTMHRDTRDGVDLIVCTVGKTVLLYDARCLGDLHARLEAQKGYRGRFAMYVPPLMEHLGRAELEHNPRNNRTRAA